MKKKLLLIIVLSLLLASTAALADGDIYTGGPAGTRISRLPYTISTPGAYYLASNLSYGNGDGITIASDHVTLDLMGFTITASSGNGINIAGLRKNVEIRNGTVISGNYGIYAGDGDNATHRIINVRIISGFGGIFLLGSGHLIQGCEIKVTGDFVGIDTYGAVIVSGCTIRTTIGTGIAGINGLVRGNVLVNSNNGGVGIQLSEMGSVVIGNYVTGYYDGIQCGSGASIIGNTVNTSSGHTGISLTDDKTNVLDQNTVCGDGTHYSPSTFVNVKNRNNL
jgi:hypothetical protein